MRGGDVAIDAKGGLCEPETTTLSIRRSAGRHHRALDRLVLTDAFCGCKNDPVAKAERGERTIVGQRSTHAGLSPSRPGGLPIPAPVK